MIPQNLYISPSIEDGKLIKADKNILMRRPAKRLISMPYALYHQCRYAITAPVRKMSPPYQLRRQVTRLHSISTGNISNLPIIIHNDITSLEKAEKAEKLPAGPTISKPGPTLLTQVSADVKDTVKEKLSREISSVPISIINR